MNADHTDLTPGERRFLERQQEAKREGVTLRQYYRSHGLSLRMLDSVRRQLVAKGALPQARPGRPRSKPTAAPSGFVAVKLAAPSQTGPGKSCRLRSPSGWVIEFDGVPELCWVSALMGVQS
jgi:hypothetical protein